MAQDIMINFTPGKLIYCPPEYYSPYYNFMYLEGNIEFTQEGIQVHSKNGVFDGVAIDITPQVIDGKPGGAFVMQNPVIQIYNKQYFFAGEAKIAMPGARIMLIRAIANGQFHFFLGPSGGIGVQLQPVNMDQLKVHGRHPPLVTAKRGATSVIQAQGKRR